MGTYLPEGQEEVELPVEKEKSCRCEVQSSRALGYQSPPQILNPCPSLPHSPHSLGKIIPVTSFLRTCKVLYLLSH